MLYLKEQFLATVRHVQHHTQVTDPSAPRIAAEQPRATVVLYTPTGQPAPWADPPPAPEECADATTRYGTIAMLTMPEECDTRRLLHTRLDVDGAAILLTGLAVPHLDEQTWWLTDASTLTLVGAVAVTLHATTAIDSPGRRHLAP